MTIPARLLVVRHGQSTWNAERRWQGWADPPLSALGEQQAHEAAASLRGLGLTRVGASDLQRATVTATILAARLTLGEVDIDPELRERNVGLFTGKTADEIRARWPACFDADTGRLISVPEGEDDEHLFLRAAPALVRLAHRHAGQVVLVVCHGGVIRAIERHLGIEPELSTPNLAGRWFEVVGDQLEAGNAVGLLEPEAATVPRSE